MPDLGQSERRAPTHIMRIEVPLDLIGREFDFDAVQDALRICLAISRAGFARAICDDPQVTMEDA